MKDEQKLIKKLEDWQKKNKNGKYHFISRGMNQYGYETEVHEYECPNGEVGYQIFLYINNTIKSIGYGQEAVDRTYFVSYQ